MKKILFGLLLMLIFLTSCGNSQSNKADIINPDADFLYFYGWSCPHCQELNKEMKEANIYDQLAIEKREVYANDANRDLFRQTAESLGLSESDMWVPFVVNKNTQEYVVGVQPAMEMFEDAINNPVETSTGATSIPTSSGTLAE